MTAVVYPRAHEIVYDLAIQQAVDDYLLMERKARAWDLLRERWVNLGQTMAVDLMDSLVHPAPAPSSS